MKMNIGRNIAGRRKLMGLTQRELSEISGISQQTINSIENERCNPSVATLVKIARALSCAVDTLIEQKNIYRSITFFKKMQDLKTPLPNSATALYVLLIKNDNENCIKRYIPSCCRYFNDRFEVWQDGWKKIGDETLETIDAYAEIAPIAKHYGSMQELNNVSCLFMFPDISTGEGMKEDEN